MSQPVLTNHLKTQIINNALEKAGIPKRKSALRAARVEWAERVRLAAIGGVEKEAEILKNIKKIESMVTKIPDSLKTNSSLIRK
ncbi:Nmad5 family putative nucleotide modification protein, partial [Escherichia coli]